MAKKAKSAAKSNQTAPYKHPEAKSLMRPEVGTQAKLKKKNPKQTYRYDDSLSRLGQQRERIAGREGVMTLWDRRAGF
jgi:hypothetical protein